MAQVVIVSNRLPVSVKKENGKLVYSQSIGGLVTGLASYVNNRNSIWIGWPGIASDELNDQEKQLIAAELAKQNYSPVFLSQKQIDEYYNGYSNTILWPLFHSLPVKQAGSDKLNRWWQAYRSVNKRFAEVVTSLVLDKSQVWIHDYQLMLLPEMLRSENAVPNIGFFLHIPFPSVKKFSQLPEAKRLLQGMAGADLIGFHTENYVENFIASYQQVLSGNVGKNQLLLAERIVRVADFPMGIDYEKYANAGKQKAVKTAMRRWQHRYKNMKVIVSVDRLDPSKGLMERLKAYDTFLGLNPQSRGKVVFSMVAAPSRTDIPAYKNLAKRLGELAKNINDKYGTDRWEPVDYINITLPFEEVTALFRIADVALIAPLRDGMNLAAKEFVASNRRRGVLILSETAGAAEELQDALIVNPKKPESLVTALETALSMRRRELRSRLKRMRKELSINTVQSWAKTFVDTMQQPLPGTPHLTRTLNKRLESGLLSDYKQAKKRLLLLDYDGSLVPFTKDYNSAKPSKSLIELLLKLGAEERNDVVLISGRSAEDLEAWFGELPISLVAEHGASLRKAGSKLWQTIEKVDTDWKKILLPSLEKYTQLTPGARVEVKPHSLVWHYRAAPPYYAQKYSVIIKRALRPILKSYGLELVQGNKILEIKNPLVSKGNAAQYWLKRNYAFILSIGDDATDEELFATLPVTAYSIKVGHGRTVARLRLGSYKDSVNILKNLAKQSA